MEHGLTLSLLFIGDHLKPEGFILVTPTSLWAEHKSNFALLSRYEQLVSQSIELNVFSLYSNHIQISQLPSPQEFYKSKKANNSDLN